MTAHVVAGDRLKRELERSAEMAGCTVDWMVERSTPWDKSCFVGGEHILQLLVSGVSNRAWLDQLDENAVYLPGFVLGELDCTSIEEKDDQLIVELYALTIKEA